MQKSAIVILNWNGRGFLEKYLPGVVESVKEYDEVEVVVADNCSTDDSIAFLGQNFPSVRILPLERNYGFAQGYDKALAMLDHELFVLLNSDVEVENGWFEPLAEWMEYHEECGICGPKLLSLENRDTFEYAGAAGGFIDKYGYPLCKGRIMDRVEKDEGQYDVPGEVFWISGAALVVRRSVFRELGGFRGDFFMHMEEIDLCWRTRLAGYRVHVVPRSKVYHLGGGTLKSDSPAKTYYNHRNNLLMLHANLPMTYAIYGGMDLLAKISDQQAGPDFFGNCFDAFMDMTDKERREFCDLSASNGIAIMRMVIFVRYLLDTLTALVYLLKGRPACMQSVVRAHRDFRRMRGTFDKKDMAKSLKKIFMGERRNTVQTMLTEEPALKCVVDKWVVRLRYFEKQSIFADTYE